MTLQFQYTFEDYREASTGQAVTQKPTRRIVSTIMWVLISVAGVAWLVFLFTLDSTHDVDKELAAPASTGWRLASGLLPTMLLFSLFAYVAIRQALRGPVKPWEAPPGKQKKPGKSLFGWIVFVGLAVCFFLLLQLSTTVTGGGTTVPSSGGGFLGLDFALGLAPWLMMFALIFILTRISRGRGLRANWDAQQNVLKHPISVEVLDTGITFAGPLARQAFSWAYFAGFKETPNLFLLYPTPFLFHMFPKRAFPSADALDYFRGMLITHVKHGQFLEQSSAFPVVPFAARAPATDPPA